MQHALGYICIINAKPMKSIVLYLFLFIAPVLLFSQVTFQKTFTLTGDDDGISSIQTSDGNYLVYGRSAGSLENNCFLMKIGTNGDSLWRKIYPNYNLWPYPISNHEPLAETNDSAYIFTTTWRDTTYLIKTNQNGDTLWTVKYIPLLYATFQPTTDGGYILCGLDPSRDLVLIKTNNLGIEQWRKLISFLDPIYPYSNRYFSIKQTTDGGYIVSGNCYHDVGSVSLLVYCFIIKANSTGDSLWVKKTDNLPLVYFSTIQSTSGNGFIAAGGLDSLTVNGSKHLNGYITKFDENGDALWSKSYGGTGNQEFNSLEKTDDGGFIACGDNNPDLTNPPPFGFYGLYLVRMDASGDTLWTKYYPGGQAGNHDIIGRSVHQTTDGGFIACGIKYDSTDHGHVFLIKTDGLGNVYPQGINDKHPNAMLSPFPNPTKGIVYLNPPGKFNVLEITDLLGNFILRRNIDPGNNSTLKIDLSNNPNGIYLLKLKNENSVLTGKIVLAK